MYIILWFQLVFSAHAEVVPLVEDSVQGMIVFSAHAEVVPRTTSTVNPLPRILRARGGSSIAAAALFV